MYILLINSLIHSANTVEHLLCSWDWARRSHPCPQRAHCQGWGRAAVQETALSLWEVQGQCGSRVSPWEFLLRLRTNRYKLLEERPGAPSQRDVMWATKLGLYIYLTMIQNWVFFLMVLNFKKVNTWNGLVYSPPWTTETPKRPWPVPLWSQPPPSIASVLHQRFGLCKDVKQIIDIDSCSM